MCCWIQWGHTVAQVCVQQITLNLMHQLVPLGNANFGWLPNLPVTGPSLTLPSSSGKIPRSGKFRVFDFT